MMEFKVRTSRSWMDSVYSKCLAAKLGERLWKRCEGEEGRMVTLTYRRDDYAGPYDLYKRASEERHMKHFIKRLARMLGPLCGRQDSKGRWTLTGKWFRKLEFQRGGWIHYHLIVLVPWIENREHELTNCWGHGYAYVQPLEEGSLKYVAKYVSKDGVLPTWLYLEKIRSVKIVASSPGFWLDTEPVEHEEGEEWGTRLDCYIPIGEMIERCEERVLYRTENKKYGQMKIRPHVLFQYLLEHGFAVTEGERGWVRFNISPEVFEMVQNSVMNQVKRAAAASPLGGPSVHGWMRKWLRIVLESESRELELSALYS